MKTIILFGYWVSGEYRIHPVGKEKKLVIPE